MNIVGGVIATLILPSVYAALLRYELCLLFGMAVHGSKHSLMFFLDLFGLPVCYLIVVFSNQAAVLIGGGEILGCIFWNYWFLRNEMDFAGPEESPFVRGAKVILLTLALLGGCLISYALFSAIENWRLDS